MRCCLCGVLYSCFYIVVVEGDFLVVMRLVGEGEVRVKKIRGSRGIRGKVWEFGSDSGFGEELWGYSSL